MATTDPSKAPSDGGAALPRDDSAADLPHVRDPCKPGLHDSRKREIRAAEQAGGAPVLWNAWLNRGAGRRRQVYAVVAKSLG